MTELVKTKTKAATSDKAPTSPKEWATKINVAWRRAANAYIETGLLLLDAKEFFTKKKGDWQKVLDELIFDEHKAQRLMKIARNEQLVDAKHIKLLPPSYSTLYTLTQLPEEALAKAFKKGDIHPNMERDDAEELVEKAKPKPLPEPQPIEDSSVISDEGTTEPTGEDEDNEPTPVKKPTTTVIKPGPTKNTLEIAIENFINGIDSLRFFCENLENELQKNEDNILPKEALQEIDSLTKLLARLVKEYS